MLNLLIFGGGNTCLEIINYLKDISKSSKKKFNRIGIVDPKKLIEKILKILQKKLNIILI